MGGNAGIRILSRNTAASQGIKGLEEDGWNQGRQRLHDTRGIGRGEGALQAGIREGRRGDQIKKVSEDCRGTRRVTEGGRIVLCAELTWGQAPGDCGNGTISARRRMRNEVSREAVPVIFVFYNRSGGFVTRGLICRPG